MLFLIYWGDHVILVLCSVHVLYHKYFDLLQGGVNLEMPGEHPERTRCGQFSGPTARFPPTDPPPSLSVSEGEGPAEQTPQAADCLADLKWPSGLWKLGNNQNSSIERLKRSMRVAGIFIQGQRKAYLHWIPSQDLYLSKDKEHGVLWLCGLSPHCIKFTKDGFWFSLATNWR